MSVSFGSIMFSFFYILSDSLIGKELFLNETRVEITITWNNGCLVYIDPFCIEYSWGRQTYAKYEFKQLEGSNVIVYIQKNLGRPPDTFIVDSTFQYGGPCDSTNDNVFLVKHDKRQKPFQQKFCQHKHRSDEGNTYLKDF